jgi:hypothetical protein
MRASWKVAITAAVLVCGTSITAAAQVTDKKALTLEGARSVIAAAIAAAKTRQAPGGVIAVVDDGGNLVALERLDDTFAAGATISIGKARTAALFKRPTKAFEDIVKNGRVAMVASPPRGLPPRRSSPRHPRSGPTRSWIWPRRRASRW